MIAVTANTNMDRPKMAFAGVDAGAKILVELNGDSVAAAADTARKEKINAKIRASLCVAKLCWCLIFIQSMLSNLRR